MTKLFQMSKRLMYKKTCNYIKSEQNTGKNTQEPLKGPSILCYANHLKNKEHWGWEDQCAWLILSTMGCIVFLFKSRMRF